MSAVSDGVFESVALGGRGPARQRGEIEPEASSRPLLLPEVSHKISMAGVASCVDVAYYFRPTGAGVIYHARF